MASLPTAPVLESSPTTLSPSTTSNLTELLGTNRLASLSPPAELDFDAQGTAATPHGPFSTTTSTHNSTFYFEEDMVEIQVEETLFRIPRTVLTLHSEHFRSLFYKRDAEGKTHEPLHLREDGIKATAFENLLHVLYPLDFGKTKISSVYEWASVLDLSTKWGFTAVRTLAIKRLVSIASPVEKIVLARIYKLDNWLKDAYTAVCERPEPLTPEELRQLSHEDIAKIFSEREAALSGLSHKKKGRRGRRSTLSNKSSGIDRTLPLSEVVEVVEHSLALLSDRDPDTQQQAQDDILDAVRHSDKRATTLCCVFMLIVTEGMKCLPGRDSPYAAVCDIITSMLGPIPACKYHTLTDSGEQLTFGRAAVIRYLTGICGDMTSYRSVDSAMNSDTAMRQAGLCANLFTRKLVEITLVEGWWDAMTLSYHPATTTKILSYHAFLSAVGHLIDLPEVQSKADKTFTSFGNSRYYEDNSWNETQSEI